MYLLLKNPDEQAKLRDNSDLMTSAIEEILRYEPSVPRAWRIVREEVTIGGKNIKVGSLIFPVLSAANRDPVHFSEPDTFNIQREDNKQLAFGYGIHFCLGAPLVRVEGAIAIDAMLKRIPGIKLKNEPNWRPDVAIRSLDSLRILCNSQP